MLRNRGSGEEYWAAFDFQGRPLAPNSYVSIRRGTTRVSIQASPLKWGKSRESVWPNGEFRDDADNFTGSGCGTVRGQRIKVEPLPEACQNIQPLQ